jgi:single-stranded-DNA-specific exonuclease
MPLLAGQLAQRFNVHPLVAQCLLNRGIDDTEKINAYLEPRLRDLSDPFLIHDMERAVDRLLAAREAREPLVIFGDYDVDGVTATALLVEVLSRLGWRTHYYLPNRNDEGYGLSDDGVENCLKKHPVKLVLAVDCGSTSFRQVESLKERGIDVVIVDHHQVSAPAPKAVALVNPRAAALANSPAARTGPVAFAEFCSVGLAFKLAHALVKRCRELNVREAMSFDLRPLLDLVALGTVADVVPLTGENRIFVAAGLQRLNETSRPGLIALKQVARSRPPLGVHELGFQLAPRLNAAGRLETAEAALNLLMAASLPAAIPIAQQLDDCNRDRQQLERKIVEEAMGSLEATFDSANHFVIVEGRPSWHIGVVGIVASRVLQRYYRPTIMMGGDGNQLRGSARSVPGFDIANALRECGDLLVRHGGHAMAAGLSIMSSNIQAFRDKFNEVAKSRLKPEELQPSLSLDGEVGLDEINFGTLEQLDKLRPVGQGNAPVQFFSCNLAHQRPLQRVGADKKHVKMWLTDGTTTHEAVWWGAGNESLPVGKFDMAFTPKNDSFKGRQTIQLKVLDWRSAQ